MPKIKPSKQQIMEKNIVNNIRAIANKNGCRYDKDIAIRSHIPVSTFNRKMNDPKKFTLTDFEQISLTFKTPIKTIFEFEYDDKNGY